MITLPQRVYKPVGGVPPYSYTVESNMSCFVVETPSGVTSDLITIDAEALDSSCIDATTITIRTTDSQGCSSTKTFNPINPCSETVVGLIMENEQYQFTLNVEAPNCAEVDIEWVYDSIVFTQNTLVTGPHSSSISLTPNSGISIPNNSIIRANVTNCFGCLYQTSHIIGTCTPQAVDVVLALHCNAQQSEYIGQDLTLPNPTGCVGATFDWANATIGFLPSGVNASITQDVTGHGILHASADITTIPGPYTFSYSVEDNLGVPSSLGTVTLDITACRPMTTIIVDDIVYQLDCSVSAGDIIRIPITYTTTSHFVIIDWSTFMLLPTPPNSQSPSISLYTDITGSHFIEYTVPAIVGSDVFNWTVCDTLGNCSEATTTTVILDCPTPPTTVDDDYCVLCNTVTILDVLTNDLTTTGPLDISSVTIVTQPTNGTANINPDGTISYTPVVNIGNDTFSYKVNDLLGQPSNEATVTITINCAGSDGAADVCN